MTRLLSLRASAFVWTLLSLLLIVPNTALAQTDESHSDSLTNSAEEAPMQAPPPVSGESYATTFTSETESNYLRLGLTVTGAYSSNILGSEIPTAGASYSIWPNITFDKSAMRSNLVLSYSPGFTIYPQTSSLNQVNQSVSFAFQYLLSPNITASVNESFNKTSNLFDQPNPLTA